MGVTLEMPLGSQTLLGASFGGGLQPTIGASDQTHLPGVPKVRSHLTFANKTGHIALERVYYRPMCFLIIARHLATRCGMPATSLRSVSGLKLAHADL